MLFRNILVGLGLMASTATSIEVTVQNEDSVKEAASSVAWSLLTFYSGNETGDVPGNLPDPYYWWLCGAMMGTLIEYWHYSGDDTYNDLVRQAIVHQAGRDQDMMPQNQTRAMGNDDQGFWAMTSMFAAEYVLPDPEGEEDPQYLAITQAVFNEFASRWDEEYCNGGLRWQVFDFNIGYEYKNSVSNGCFFNVASRLARYTGNDTYAEWANKIWDWEKEVGLLTDKWVLKDGTTIEGDSCSHDIDATEWSYNSGIWLHGAAIMYNYTESEKWGERVDGILNHGLERFVQDNVVYEQFCEPHDICDDDQRSFKGYYLRWLAGVNILATGRYTDRIMPVLRASAEAAALSCTGTPTEVIPNHPAYEGVPGEACGFAWDEGKFDGLYGVPEQMNALAALFSTLDGTGPVSADTGGTSKGDPGAGTDDEEKTRVFEPITIGDKVGAGFLTTLVLAGLIGGCTFVIH